MVKVIKADKVKKTTTKLSTKKVAKTNKAAKLNDSFGMWKNRWKGKTSVEVADMLRKRSQIRYAH